MVTASKVSRASKDAAAGPSASSGCDEAAEALPAAGAGADVFQSSQWDAWSNEELPVSYGERLVLETYLRFRGRRYDRSRMEELCQPRRIKPPADLWSSGRRQVLEKEQLDDLLKRLAGPKRGRATDSGELIALHSSKQDMVKHRVTQREDVDKTFARLSAPKTARGYDPTPGEKVCLMYNQTSNRSVDLERLANMAQPKKRGGHPRVTLPPVATANAANAANAFTASSSETGAAKASTDHDLKEARKEEAPAGVPEQPGPDNSGALNPQASADHDLNEVAKEEAPADVPELPGPDNSAALDPQASTDHDLNEVVRKEEAPAGVPELPGPDNSAPSAAKDPGEYTISLDKSTGASLGIDLNHKDGETLLIEVINPGLVQDWNEEGSNKDKVRVGDRILEVNGIAKDALLLMEECEKNQVLTLKLRRA